MWSLPCPVRPHHNRPSEMVGTHGFLTVSDMSPLSDRQLDAFDNPAKAACREGNLRVLREAAYLLWADGDRTRLRCDWCELMGATGWLTLDLLERVGVLAPGGFVGIDLDPTRIADFRERRPDLKWVAGNLYERLEA